MPKHENLEAGGSIEVLHLRDIRRHDCSFQGEKRSIFASDQSRKHLPSAKLIPAIIEELCKVEKETADPEFGRFMRNVISAHKQNLKPTQEAAPIVGSLRHSFIEQGPKGLRIQIKYAYHGYLANQRFSKSNLQDQARVADMRYPVEWYPATRQMQRTIHLHVGPTNSGKTYHALKKLEQAESGLYAGPLRLLAHEVYTKLNAKGKPCHLITGDERHVVEADNVTLTSCTVEMVSVNEPVDVAVIDEIQMIGHEERGWAWTQALLGLRAKELHLCGEERTVPLIRELAAAMGDDLQVHHYQRLSPLKIMSKSLKGDLGNLRKGDCIVGFSKLMIHRYKQWLETTTGKPVAVIYGGLPPEVRAHQAVLFNDPNNDYDVLVASDAIGMGLNLSIKRIVFSATRKFNGRVEQPIEAAQIKQIAGRAGRYRVASQADGAHSPVKELSGAGLSPDASSAKTLGLVTTLEREDLPALQTAMTSQPDPIMSAGILPPVDVVVKFAAYFPPSTPFSYILLRLHSISALHPRFFLCALKNRLEISDIIEPVQGLTISDRIIFCASPASPRHDSMRPILRAFAECVARKSGGAILDIPALKIEHLNVRYAVQSIEYLQNLELLHMALVLYLWLSYRFAGIFTTREMAFYVKGLVEERIQQALSKLADKRKRISKPPTGRIVGHITESMDPDANDAGDGSGDGLLGIDQSLGPSIKPDSHLTGNINVDDAEGSTQSMPDVGLDVTIPDFAPTQQSLSSAP
ncbi:MAG: hypothetical protein Q9170_001221 [Blastenia crenularia]